MISIILPVYNEGENITEQIEEIDRTVKPKHEVIVIFDFDEDNTVGPVRKLQKKYKSLILVKNIFGRGIINAVKTGFIQSKGKAVVVMPADLADTPKTINNMYKKITDGFDIVCATRYSGGGTKIGGGILKTALSRTAGLLTPLLLGISSTDISNGFKMYRRQVLETIKIESDGGWEFAIEIVIKAKKMGFKICDVPSIWKDRELGKSKFKFTKWLPKYMKWYLKGILWRFN